MKRSSSVTPHRSFHESVVGFDAVSFAGQGSRDHPGLRAELEAVGESNRMTLKFRKPE
jgi:predicted methyltransferase